MRAQNYLDPVQPRIDLGVETPLQRRHRKLPSFWREVIDPGSKRLQDFTREGLCDLRKKRSLAAMAVEFNVSQPRLERSIKTGKGTKNAAFFAAAESPPNFSYIEKVRNNEYLTDEEVAILLATETRLQRRYRMLPPCWRDVFEPGEKRLEDFTHLQLLNLRQERSIAAMAVEFGISEAKLERALDTGEYTKGFVAAKSKPEAKCPAKPRKRKRKAKPAAKGPKSTKQKLKKKDLPPEYILEMARSMPRAELLARTGMTPSQLGRVITQARDSVDT